MLGKLTRGFLWPGTYVVNKMGIDPDAEMGLLRSMFNMLFWISLGLFIGSLFY